MASLSLREASKIEKQIAKFVENKIASEYTWTHDEHYNLTLVWGDSTTVKIPLIDLRIYQLGVQVVLFSGISKRILLEWPRRAGKEVVTWQLLVHAAIIDAGMYIMVYPTNVRARKILWEGSALINGKSTKFLDMVPSRLIDRKNHADMTIELVNGSIIWVVGSDTDPEKFRGTNAR